MNERKLNEALAGHFHKHCEFSPLDGGGNANQYTWAAVQNEQTHQGLTDHGRLGGSLEHFHACRHPEKYDHPFEADRKRTKDERITPVLGIEAFFRRNRFMECNSTWAHHLCLHAGSLQGWRTLMRLSSKSWVRRENGGGYYGKPVMDFEMIDEDHEDIIISTACLGSPLAYHIMKGDDVGAKRFLRKMRKVSKNGIVWLEIMPHNLDEQREVNLGIVNLAQETGDPLMVTGDVHIPFEGWEKTHEVIRLASYKQNFSHREMKKEAGEDVYTDAIDTVFLSSGSQMFAQFQKYHPDLPEDIVIEAMRNTHEFARQVNWYVIGQSTKAPQVDVDAKAEVAAWVEEGWQRVVEQYPDSHWKQWSRKTYTEREHMEFNVLDEKGVLPYFYIVGDFVRWAKSDLGLPKVDKHGQLVRDKRGRIQYEGTKRPIRVGLGRGSAAGCLVSYLIGITAIDPISHRLLFERFLNPDRVGYPDIDVDFETELPVITLEDGTELDGRGCVKEYLKRKYGHDHVVDIIAYQTFAPRVAIKEVGAVFELSWPYMNDITESIGDTERGLERIANGVADKDIEPNKLVAGLREKHPDVWDVLLKLEDSILRDTRHAGGVVITPKPTNFYIPTQLGADEVTTVTAWADRADFPIMADYGFLKYDILGVRSLAKQEVACQFIREYYDEDFEPNELPALRNPFDVDMDVIDLFVKGVMWEVFQFAGRGITQLLRHIRPDNATDISVANALYRPGPIAIAFEYGDRKQGTTPVTYWHDSLEPILGETLGLMCFQEQAMEVVKQLAGFSGADADNFRKIMSKLYRLPGDKAQQIMSKDRDRFIHGCMTISGLREKEGAMIFDDHMLPLGNYLFNRSHSSSYGLQAYQDGHIKKHYPLAFYAAALTVGGGRSKKKEEKREWMKAGLREARIFDIEAAAPDVNSSDRGWTIDKNKLRYGLASITGLGGGLAQEVMDYRPYVSYDQFLEQIPSGFGADKLVALAKGGAFDELEDREFLLSHTRQWAEGIAKLKVKMDCGHLKTKTIKLTGEHRNDDLEEAINYYLDHECECKHHPEAVPVDYKRLDDTYEVARFKKEHPGQKPVIDHVPTLEEINEMELAALNVPLSLGHTYMCYKPFIEARIFTEEEIEELPQQPNRKAKKHGMFCGCEECDAAFCIVGGEVVNTKIVKTKKERKEMAFVDIAFGLNHYNCVFFPGMYVKYAELLKRPTIFMVSGHKGREGNVLVSELVDVIEVAAANDWRPDTVVSIGSRRVAKKLKRRKVAA